MFYFFQPLYLEELGADPVKIGGILGLVGLATGLSFLPAGYLSDRLGRRPMIYFAWILGTIAAWIMAIANSLSLFVVGMVFYGMTAYVTVPLNSYITHARGKWSVGRTITFISASFSLGFIVGPLIGGWLGAKSGLHANFKYAGLIFIISTLMIFFIRSQPVESHESAGKSDGLKSFKNIRYIQFIVLVFLIMFSLYLPQPLTQNFLRNERDLNLIQIGQLISARSIGVVLLNLFLGQLNSRLGLLIAQLCIAIFTLSIWWGSNFQIYLLGYTMLGAYVTARGLIMAQGRTLVQAANMGITYGMIETVNAMALITGPVIAGFLYTQNPELIYSASIVLILFGFIVNLLWSPIKSQDVFRFEENEKVTRITS